MSGISGNDFSSHNMNAMQLSYYLITRRDLACTVNLSKCFLDNRDNFCPYERALSQHEIKEERRKNGTVQILYKDVPKVLQEYRTRRP